MFSHPGYACSDRKVSLQSPTAEYPCSAPPQGIPAVPDYCMCPTAQYPYKLCKAPFAALLDPLQRPYVDLLTFLKYHISSLQPLERDVMQAS